MTTEEAGDLATLAKCNPMVACIGGLYGEENCNPEYHRERCASCSRARKDGFRTLKHYRLEGECFPCPEEGGTPVWMMVVAGIVAFVLAALAVDRALAKVKNVSQLLAPALILMTFFQTLALLLQVSLSGLRSCRN